MAESDNKTLSPNSMQAVDLQFLDYLNALGWRFQPPASADAATVSPRPEHQAFLALFSELSSPDETQWFLSWADYAGTNDSAFAWDEFRQISLDAAIDTNQHAQLVAFWEQHLPFFIRVRDGYEFLAIRRDDGAVVHGAEPEFEATTLVAAGLQAWFASVISGHSALIRDQA